MARRENRLTPKVLSGILYNDPASLVVGSPSWFSWLECGKSFYYESNRGTFTARAEHRGSGLYWYAYRRHRGRLFKRYIGLSQDLDSGRLHEVAIALDGLVNPQSEVI